MSVGDTTEPLTNNAVLLERMLVWTEEIYECYGNFRNTGVDLGMIEINFEIT